MINRRINSVEATHKYEALLQHKEYIKQQRERFEKQENEIEAELHQLSEVVPELKRKKIVETAAKLLAEIQADSKLAFKEQGDITVCVDISYDDASVIDEYDVGIREFKRSAYGVPKNQTIERLIAAHEALNKTIPSEFLEYYSIR